MKRNILIALCAWSLIGCAQPQGPKIIAHRGYFNAEGAAQNSIAALRGAAELGVYGSEFDVRMTLDSVLVVYPNGDINGKKIREVQYADIQSDTLSNGETLPTLDAMLEAAKAYPKLLLVIDLKDGRDCVAANRAADKTIEMVGAKGLQDRVKYISFNMDILMHVVKVAPEATISFLASDGGHPAEELRARGLKDVDYKLQAIMDDPTLVEKAHAAGLKVDAWTLNTPEDFRAMWDLGADYLETDYPDQALNWAKE